MAELPTSIMEVIQMQAVHGLQRMTADVDLATGRARDTALHGLKCIESVAAKELLVADDAGDFARTNAAIRVPTTLDHPGVSK